MSGRSPQTQQAKWRKPYNPSRRCAPESQDGKSSINCLVELVDYLDRGATRRTDTLPTACQVERLLPNDRLGSEAVRLRMGIDRHKTPRTNMRQWEREGYASITCHLASHNFIAGFRVEYGNSDAGMHRGAFSLRRKRLHHDRVHAQASTVRAWRAIQAESRGARAAANMYPASNRIHCQHAPGNEGWRCFVRGGPCHTI